MIIHKGFGADHGKFKRDYEPQRVIAKDETTKCWMSAREGATIKPNGWICYNIEDGGQFRIEFSDTSVTAQCSNSLKVSVTNKNIVFEMGQEFKDKNCDINRQFEILVTNNIN